MSKLITLIDTSYEVHKNSTAEGKTLACIKDGIPCMSLITASEVTCKNCIFDTTKGLPDAVGLLNE